MIPVEASAQRSDVTAGAPACPVCSREAREGLAPFDQLPDELKRLVAANSPGEVAAVCVRCLELFERARVQLEKYAAIFEQGRYVLPTWLRLGADERFTGRGVCMAFLDSGFYQHPDLTTPASRILAYHNIMPCAQDSSSCAPSAMPAWSRGIRFFRPPHRLRQSPSAGWMIRTRS